MIDLSVLICSTHTRYKTFGRAIQDQIWEQYAQLAPGFQNSIEIIMLTDNKQMMLGQKRNTMVDMAQGKYVVFVDDDDRIEPDYLVSLVDAIHSDADVITFLVSVSLNGDKPKICRYSKDFPRDRNTPTEYQRIPNHICCIKKEIALKSSFPNLAHGEDSAYSKLLLPHLHTEHHIPRVLYHYDYSDEHSETQQHRRAALRVRPGQAPIVDVIILSDAKTLPLKTMTQKTIDTCISGANSLPVNIIVMEQQMVKYRRAFTVHCPEEFHYNAFANRGAKLGRAEWIMVANNDLLFYDGWLHQLLAADYPLVSPRCPKDSRQAGITTNTVGGVNGKHLSGWCYMIHRDIWSAIGGFDECVSFWCSDDVVIEQVKQLGIEPMLVPGAKVRHLRSQTLKQSSVMDDLTWAQLDVFNKKYGKNKFGNNPQFREWKKQHGEG